ncbi:hypothetical protein [Nitrosospira multiformis]|uniref:hypothetical protein n=1 Tax=Nitrosospira multiformis TaxID=1231 RepID=UPI0009BFED96|nr:hypothetical protein [Nitrosospira multiformis]
MAHTYPFLAIATNNKVGVRPPTTISGPDQEAPTSVDKFAQMLSIDFPYEKSDQAIQRVSPEAAASSALLQQI